MDRLERSSTNLSRLVRLRKTEIEGDVLNPEVGRIGRSEKQSFEIGDGRRGLRSEISGLIFERREILSLLLRFGGDGFFFVVGIFFLLDLGGSVDLVSFPVESSSDGERSRLDDRGGG